MKSDRESQISYDTTYMWNLKKWYKWAYLQDRNRLTDIENKLMVTKGDSGGRGEDTFGDWDWHIHTTIYSKSPTYEPSSSELLKMQTCIPSTSGMSENCCLLFISYCCCYFSSTTSHLLSLLQSVTLLTCSLYASPYMLAVVPYYCTFQATVL